METLAAASLVAGLGMLEMASTGSKEAKEAREAKRSVLV